MDSSMRVLTRPPNLNHHQTTLAAPIPLPKQTDHPSNGVVVVGFIGRRSADVTYLVNRVLDAHVFGSGNSDKDLLLGFPKGNHWFSSRRISYYYDDDDEKRILYLQFSSTACPAMEQGFPDESSCSSSSSGFDSVSEEELEFGDLQGMLFMFSVCHVIIFIQEGSRFDTQILKRFRILQSAKHAMSPFVKSQTSPPSTSSSHSSSSRSSVSGVSSNNRSPGRSGVILSRNASAISIRSGLGSYTSLFPGQCTPVILFVFLDDFSDVNTGTSNTEEIIDTSSLNQSSSLTNLATTSLPPKGSVPVVMLARPVSKSEGVFKKKLQSSLEAQIRFSIKKCRTLAGSETSHAGSRSGAISNSAPLFSLDASKAVALLDIYSNQSGKSLDFATGLVEDVLNGKATSDSLLLETHSQSATQEDIVSVKEFIYRQADLLRGRGGVVTNTNSGSAAGVGMVAVAAAAAAASAASGKPFTIPELPSVDIWLSSSLLILQGILSAESGCMIESDKRNPGQKNTAPGVEGVVSRVTDNTLQVAASCLEGCKGLNSKFSTLWCQRALPTAKEVYLSDLPACYPTSKHEEQLEKALRAFCSMVKGPAVPLYMKQLENECTSIWSSGRQLCDAVSLTGKPCMHQRHDVETNGLVSRDGVKPHSSGYVFLKACACGRSRLLQSDPFDFETANVTSSDFADCDKILPSVQLPQVKNVGPIQPSSWSLIRVGGAKYYDPVKGLLQSGFCATRKFLLKWKIFLEKPKNQHGLLSSAVPQDSVVKGTELLNGSISGGDLKNSDASLINMEESQSGNEIQREHLYENNQSDEKKLSFGRGIPSFTMRKPFSEVVAGSAAAISGFPPLQSRKQLSVGSENSMKQSSTRDRVAERVHHTADYKGSQPSIGIPSVQDTGNASQFGVNGYGEGNPILQIGSNVVPVNMSSGENIGLNETLKNVIVYIGFEHECPRGHRFILTTEHLKELGSPYSLSEESHIRSSIENSDNERPDPSKLGRNGTHGRAHRISNRMNNSAVRKARNADKTKDMAVDCELEGKQQTQSFIGMPTLNESVKDGLHSVSLDDGAFSLLNRNIPIYMDCPHCRTSKNKKDTPKIKFAGTMSQLQRIFLVTPPFPVVLATCPVIQFEESCLPPSVPDREQKLQFTFGCRVILPPESFLSLRLPFVYGVQLEDGSLQSLRPFEYQPEVTAWIAKGTTLQVISKESTMFDGTSEN